MHISDRLLSCDMSDVSVADTYTITLENSCRLLGNSACLAIFQQLLLAVHKHNLILFVSMFLQFFIDALDAPGILVWLWIYVAAFVVTARQNSNQNDGGAGILLFQQAYHTLNPANKQVAFVSASDSPGSMSYQVLASARTGVSYIVKLHSMQSANAAVLASYVSTTCMQDVHVLKASYLETTPPTAAWMPGSPTPQLAAPRSFVPINTTET